MNLTTLSLSLTSEKGNACTVESLEPFVTSDFKTLTCEFNLGIFEETRRNANCNNCSLLIKLLSNCEQITNCVKLPNF